MDERGKILKASWDDAIKEQSMSRTITYKSYKRTIYTDQDIAKMLGVNKSHITLVRDPMLGYKRWQVIVEEIIDDVTEAINE